MNKKSLKEYRIWRGMKSRCYSPSQTKGNYKKNHINVCDRWRYSFANFMEDMGPMPGSDYSIERIDVTGDYEPSNCKWIPQRDQPKNRGNCILVTVNDQTMCLKDYARFIGVKYSTIYSRYRRNGRKLEIPNDLKAVDEGIRRYYDL